MKVAVDGRELAGAPTGVGRYLAELLTQWSTSADARRHQWHVYAPRAVTLPPALRATATALAGHGGTHWEQVTLQRALARQRPDVLFAPGYSAPLTAPCPVALTVHDVSFAAHPEWFHWREGMRRRTLTAWSARRAAIVITDSAFSRDEIVRWLAVAPGKLRVIPLGPPAALPRLPHVAREPMVLYVGSIFARRHVDRLIEAFVTGVAPRVPGSRLEIVGANRTFPAQDLAAQRARYAPALAQRVGLHEYVDDETLCGLYARATVFAFLSDYEGFGLTPLEAMAAGVPPVVLDTAVAREVYGAAARYVDADLRDVSALADALVDLLTDAGARAGLLHEGVATLARYDWGRTAAATLAAIEEAAGAR